MDRIASINREFDRHLARWAWGDALDVRYLVADIVSRILEGPVLDVGCGPGTLLAQVPPAARAVGLDVSDEVLRVARHSSGAKRLVCADARAMPFPDASFRAVVMAMFPMDRYDSAPVIAEVARVSHDDALLVATVPNRGHRRYRWNTALYDSQALRDTLQPHFDVAVQGYNPLPMQRGLQRFPRLMHPVLRLLSPLALLRPYSVSLIAYGRRLPREGLDARLERSRVEQGVNRQAGEDDAL